MNRKYVTYTYNIFEIGFIRYDIPNNSNNNTNNNTNNNNNIINLYRMVGWCCWG